MTKRTLEIELPDEMWERLDRLASGMPYDDQTVETLVTHLLDHVQQGLYRSGAWERQWLIQCVGEDAVLDAYRQDDDPAFRSREAND